MAMLKPRQNLIGGILTLLAAACGLVTPAAAIENWMQGHEIAEVFQGQTLEGRYASGKAFTERYQPDGRLEYLEGGSVTGGRWSVTEGTLCTIYDTDPSGGCYRVSRVGENCYEFYFVARTEAAAPGPENAVPHWTARGALSGKGTACEEPSSV